MLDNILIICVRFSSSAGAGVGAGTPDNFGWRRRLIQFGLRGEAGNNDPQQ